MVFERLRSGYQSLGQGDGGEKGGVESISQLNPRYKAVAIGLAFLSLIYIGFSGKSPSSLMTSEEIVPDAKYFHVLITADKPDANLCKTLVSAGSLDYPVPNIITWNATFNDTGALDNGAHVARLAGTLDYLNMVTKDGTARDADVVMILDGYDTWFQLRPDVMLERFYEINRQANNRVVKRLGQAAMDAEGISQRVIFGAQKHCSRAADDPACYAVPQSTLSKDAYGGKADRERYLNAGFIMGEVLSTKKLIGKALEQLKADKEKGTTQDTFSRIFGEQEFNREVIYEKHLGVFSRYYHGFLKSLGFEQKSILAPHATHIKIHTTADSNMEYNIGLDYEGLLSHKTDPSNTLEPFSHDNSEKITALLKANKIPTSSSKASSTLPADINRSLPPFWSRNPEPLFPKSPKNTWSSVSLFTNLWTGSIPASIHHSSPRSDDNSLRKTGWAHLWTQPYARTLLDGHVFEPYHSFAVLRGAQGETAWWPMHQQKWKVRNHGGGKKKEWIKWEWLCTEDVAQEVFRDGKGMWKPPRHEY